MNLFLRHTPYSDVQTLISFLGPQSFLLRLFRNCGWFGQAKRSIFRRTLSCICMRHLQNVGMGKGAIQRGKSRLGYSTVCSLRSGAFRHGKCGGQRFQVPETRRTCPLSRLWPLWPGPTQIQAGKMLIWKLLRSRRWNQVLFFHGGRYQEYFRQVWSETVQKRPTVTSQSGKAVENVPCLDTSEIPKTRIILNYAPARCSNNKRGARQKTERINKHFFFLWKWNKRVSLCCFAALQFYGWDKYSFFKVISFKRRQLCKKVM